MKDQARGLRGRGAGWWVTVGGIVFSAVFLAVGLALGGVSVSYVTSAEHARGTVVAVEWSGGSSGRRAGNGPTAHPVVVFSTPDGTVTRFRGSTGSNPPAYDTGERVDVLYRADSPADARIDGFVSLWLLPLVFTGVGLLTSGVTAAVGITTRRRRLARPS
jgi:hypothetical protein